MSQIQLQSIPPTLSGSSLLNKPPQSIVSQPLMSIPPPAGSLPSENAGRPIQNSALPSTSATAASAAAVSSNMANPKEKTPMCLVNELARFNKIQPEYKLLSEQGPAHSKVFTVQLTLGDQHWEAEGTSIKKAQHAAAARALAETKYPKPVARSPRNEGKNPDSVTPTVELNALCIKLGQKPVYKPIDPYTGMRQNYNYNNMRGGAYPSARYYYPFPAVGQIFYQVELSIGGVQFLGKGRTRQAAKHDAAAKALKILQAEPLPDKKTEINGKEFNDENLSKSEISQVFEIALKRNMPVNFEVTKETGPPHMKSFVTKVAVGDFVGEGEGKSKKISKKNAAISVLEELKQLPPLPIVEKMKPRSKKKTKSIVKVKVGVQSAEGMGSNKKAAKRNAAERMLELLGFLVPQPQPPKPALKTDEKVPVKKSGDGRKVTFFEPGTEDASTGNKDDDFRMPYPNHPQLPAGILPMVPEVAQAVGASQGHHTKEFSRATSNPVKATLTAMIARELLYGGTSPTAETILKNSNSMHLPHGPLARPSEQLEYLASVQGLQVDYKDFPKNNKNEFVSLINCACQPPLVSHGIGKDVDSCHDMAALNILKLLSELDQQSTEVPRTGNGPISVCVKQELESDPAVLKPANSSTLGQTLDSTA
ncbi:double-stranded RNA-binding protein Staufen homolog 1 isoform X2 [Protopterus annectens]|uniref:double-stranded RNA-binding protein Staufen homolog 1 isoform X2 n=1 Tax=Protopterus annectens TaxID=7888 RepID=UPI001CFAC1DF|nr:double-stranded RNA-binding protein Staufen homolog 1 isoform X2 [Protopterus annectens]